MRKRNEAGVYFHENDSRLPNYIISSREDPHLHLLDNLLAEGADLGGAGDGHVL